MPIIRWDPFDDLDRWFEDFPGVTLPRLTFDLAVNVYEQDGNVIAKMNLPGIDPAKIDISVDEDVLRISGSREEEKEEKGKEFYRKEIRSGSFSRAVRLPKVVDAEKVDAEYKDGVLKVTMPVVKGEKEGTKIKVRT